MEYKDRTYRNHLKKGRWETFTVTYKATDLWIGVDKASYNPQIVDFSLSKIKELYLEMESYLRKDPNYATALTPYTPSVDTPEIFREMSQVSEQSGIGPMSAVAGAVACRIGLQIKNAFHTQEVIVENGGDIYADIQEDMDVFVFAGSSPLSERVGFIVSASYSPIGICTSSGTVGPSLSFGKADAVMIICKNCALADTYATALGNCIQTKEDIDPCMEKIKMVKDIIAAICIKDDKVGIIGDFKLKINGKQ